MNKLNNELKNIMNMKGHLTSDMLELMLKQLAKKYQIVIRWRDRDITTGQITYKVISY